MEIIIFFIVMVIIGTVARGLISLLPESIQEGIKGIVMLAMLISSVYLGWIVGGWMGDGMFIAKVIGAIVGILFVVGVFNAKE